MDNKQQIGDRSAVLAAVRLALAESCPWYVTERQRDNILLRVMMRVDRALTAGGGGPGEERARPLGGGGPGEER